jgi:hypothetical protein
MWVKIQYVWCMCMFTCICVWVHICKLTLCLYPVSTLTEERQIKIVRFEFLWWWLWRVTILWNVTSYILVEVTDVSSPSSGFLLATSLFDLLPDSEGGSVFLWSITKICIRQHSITFKKIQHKILFKHKIVLWFFYWYDHSSA